VDIRLICCDGNQTGVVQESGLRRVNKVHRGQGQDLCREPPEPWTCWCRIPNIQYSTYNIILYYPAPARTSYSYILFQLFRCHRVSSSCQAPSEFLTHLTTQLHSTQLNSTQLNSTQLNSTQPIPTQHPTQRQKPPPPSNFRQSHAHIHLPEYRTNPFTVTPSSLTKHPIAD
jgi:hypothetical protein